MARRRRRKAAADLASALVGLGILLAITFHNQLEAFLKVAVATALFVGVVAAIVVYLRRSPVQNPIDTKSSPISSSKCISTSGASLVDEEFSRRLTKSDNAEASKNSIPTQWSMELIKELDWKRFEELCAAYFVAKGRRAEVTNLGADGGVDVLLYGHNDTEKVLGVVQCKAWSRKPVGVKEVRELFGVMNDVKCPLGVYVTTSGYTPDAQVFAKNKHIKLMNAAELLRLILDLPAEVKKRLLEETTAGDYRTPSCPNCGIKLVSRTARHGSRSGQRFWGCRNYPGCRYTMHARSA
jgi:restriction system protein